MRLLDLTDNQIFALHTSHKMFLQYASWEASFVIDGILKVYLWLHKWIPVASLAIFFPMISEAHN